MQPHPLRRVTQVLLAASLLLLALATGFVLGAEQPQRGGALQVHDLEDRRCLETLDRELASWPDCRPSSR